MLAAQVTMLLFLLVVTLNVYFMLKVYSDFKSYRDPAFAVFFIAAGAVLVFLISGFLHFEPWKQFIN